MKLLFSSRYVAGGFIAAVVVLGLALGAAAAGEGPGPTPAIVSGPDLKLEVHGFIHVDYLGYDRDEKSIAKVEGSLENTVYVRRARLVLKGKLFGNIGFFLQTAFDAPGPPFLADAQVSIPLAPWLDFQAGLMKIPFSAERLKGYNHQPFMERSLAINLEPRRSQGAQLILHPADSDVVCLHLGAFTGENLVAPNTDDDFEYIARLALRLDRIFDGFPGVSNIGGAYAMGRRVPENGAANSFAGKTINGFVFFQAVPVNGMRTRYEADADWRYGPVMIGGEYIKCIEERHDVEINLITSAGPTGKLVRDLDPLEETGWNVYVVWVLTGEEAKPMITPAHEWGAVSVAARYSTVRFTSGDRRIPTDTPGVYDREFNDTSQALGRSSIGDTVRDLYVGTSYDLKTGVFFQAAAVWQWWDSSSPFADHPDRHADVNYRARVGVIF